MYAAYFACWYEYSLEIDELNSKLATGSDNVKSHDASSVSSAFGGGVFLVPYALRVAE